MSVEPRKALTFLYLGGIPPSIVDFLRSSAFDLFVRVPEEYQIFYAPKAVVHHQLGRIKKDNLLQLKKGEDDQGLSIFSIPLRELKSASRHLIWNVPPHVQGHRTSQER
jgi:hypothetical protein